MPDQTGAHKPLAKLSHFSFTHLRRDVVIRFGEKEVARVTLEIGEELLVGFKTDPNSGFTGSVDWAEA